jgi:peptidoglycan/LPS O-acetylase OafA/YrhL
VIWYHEKAMLTKASRIYDRTYLPGLDLLRLFAALLILLDDLGAFSAAHPGVGPPFAFQPLNLASRFGWVGVEIFFVISGFGLAISANRRTASEFIKRRLIRIMPVLWAGVSAHGRHIASIIWMKLCVSSTC